MLELKPILTSLSFPLSLLATACNLLLLLADKLMKRLLKNTITKKYLVCIIKNACGSFVILNRNRGPDPFWVAESDFESEMILFTLEEEENFFFFYFSRDQNIKTEFLSLSEKGILPSDVVL